MNTGITFYAPISSASVELLESKFCLLEMLETNTHNRDIVAPVQLQKYGCIAYDAPTHHFMMFILSTLNIYGMWMVDLMYCSNHYSSRQSSLSGLPTHVGRNTTAVWISLLMRGVANKSCVNEWWNAVAQYFPKIFLLAHSLTFNRCSADGVATLPFIVSGKSDTILFRKYVIVTPNSSSTDKSRSIPR